MLETLTIDIKSLLKLNHTCTGCKKSDTFCCGCYDVCIRTNEIPKIIGMMPLAVKYCKHLENEDYYDNVFESMGKGLHSIDTTENGLCIFAYRHKSGIRCALHSAALEHGIPLASAKPLSCILWPLAISSGNNKVLSTQDDALEFHCNSRRRAGARSLCSDIGDILEFIFGIAVRQKVELAAKKSLNQVRVQVKKDMF